MKLVDLIERFGNDPMLTVSAILIMGVILVNGWTDAPNAIATCISTRAIGARRAVIMAAVFNFLGVLVMTYVNAAVAFTIYHMVDLGKDARLSLIALCAAMAAIVLWSVAAWYFGIPTSESHALIAGLSGAAVAIQNSFSGICVSEWCKVIYGLAVSVLLGFVSGFVIAKIVATLFCEQSRLKCTHFFAGAQVAGGAAMAFMHGAQDGQKFMAVFLMGAAMAEGQADISSFSVPFWLMIVCSAVMGLGTSIGGQRIIRSVGMDMVRLKPYQGFAADLAATLCLLLSSLCGLPVSTTHTKTTAIMGVGAARRIRNVNWSVVGELLLTWVFTFPGCGLLGYNMAKLFLLLFA